MAAPNLEKMNTRELKDLIANAEAMISKKQKEERKAALQAAQEAASKFGFNLSELIDGGSKPAARKGAKRQLAPKFRHPENPDLTWSGVGRKPRWIIEAEQAGKLDGLKIS